MSKLIKKEFALAMHPTVPMMLALSLMVLIPNYPYGVIFFYISMAIFFTCLSGRENNDVVYSLNLPVAKKDIVKARFIYAIILEFIQMIIMTPFIFLSQHLTPTGNLAGMDPNLALFGLALITYGVFNFVFFLFYYKNVNKVGIAFLISSVFMFIIVILDVVSTYAIPFVRDVLDTPGSVFMGQKLGFFCIGLCIYALLTGIACKMSIRNFEKQDLN